MPWSASLRLKKSARERELAPRTPSFGWEVNFLMSLIALYIPMVLTDWGIAPSSSATASSIEKGKAAMWIQVWRNSLSTACTSPESWA